MNMISLLHFRYEVVEMYSFLLILLEHCSMIFIHVLTVFHEHICGNNEMGIDDMDSYLRSS